MALSLSQVFLDAAARFVDHPAVVREDGATTYGELAADVHRLAGRLAELGLGGARVGVLMPNLPDFPLVLHGLLRAGGSALMLNPANSPREVEEYLRDAGVDAVLTTTPLLALLPRGVRALLVDELPLSLRLVSEAEDRALPLDGAPAPPPPPSGGDREAAVLFTAAERGRARGAVLTHRNLVANLRSTVEAMRLGPDDRGVAALPLIHAFGLTVSLNATLAAGAALVPMERFNPLRLLDLLTETRATVFAGVPAMFIGLLAAAERRGAPEHSLRLALCGGSPLSPLVQERWEEVFGLPLRQGYGLTEAGPVCLFNRVDRPNRPGTLGYPFPGVEVSIRDLDGTPLPDGEVGEICVRGDNVFPGYLDERDDERRTFHRDWLRTGDLGSREADGAVRFRGVVKPMFTRSGFNVYPREIERVLLADPRVAAATVAAQPEPARENDVLLTVTPAAGHSLTEEEVRELCRTRLAAYKQPTKIEVGSGIGIGAQRVRPGP